MQSFVGHLKLLPVMLLAVLAIGTSVQIGCGGSISPGPGDDATKEDPSNLHSAYGYGYGGYGYGGYGYGGYGGYGYGGYGGYGHGGYGR